MVAIHIYMLNLINIIKAKLHKLQNGYIDAHLTANL